MRAIGKLRRPNSPFTRLSRRERSVVPRWSAIREDSRGRFISSNCFHVWLPIIQRLKIAAGDPAQSTSAWPTPSAVQRSSPKERQPHRAADRSMDDHARLPDAIKAAVHEQSLMIR